MIVLSLVLPPVVVALQLASCRPQIDINPPKEPIKIEVKVELHIYQHAVQDLGYITGAMPAPEITPEPAPPAEQPKESRASDILLRLLGVGVAYAETVPDQQQLKNVLESMRKRYPILAKYKADGSIGENRSGLAEERSSEKMSDVKYAAAVRKTIAEENADRKLLYEIRARIDGTSAQAQAIAYAKAWREKYARPGEWIEVPVEGKWVWRQK
jgi:uncharacterized protein YdbL (DUF1318 family)